MAKEKLTGGQLWRLRTKQPRPRIFADAQLLWEEATKYFEWCDNNPWKKTELVKHQGLANPYQVPIGRPYSIDGLTSYLGVSGSYFRTAKKELKEKIEKGTITESEVELIEMIERIEQNIRAQQIEGATVGVFSPQIVARINGLAENTNVSNSGETVVRITVRDQDTADKMKELDTQLDADN